METHDSAAVLILTGPSGAGKTTIARALISNSPHPAVLLHADQFWRFIEQGLMTPHLPEARAQNATVISAIAAAANAYASGGYFVVIDGVIGPWHLDPVRAAVTAPLHYLVLRPDIGETLIRATLRGNVGLTGDGLPASAIRHLHARFADLGPLETHIIDSTGSSASETLMAVRQRLAAGSALLTPMHKPS